MEEEDKLREINSLSEQTSSGDGSSAESCMLESEYERLEKEGKIKNRVYVCGLGWMLPTVTVYGCGCGCGCGCGEEGCGEEGCGCGCGDDDFCPNCGELKDHCYCGYGCGCGEDDDENEDGGNNNIIVPDIPGYNGGNGGGGGWIPGNDPVHTYIDEIVDIADVPVGLVESIGESLKYTGEDKRMGNNGCIYVRKQNGQIFYSNQHVATMSLKALGQSIEKVAGKVSGAITLYNIGNAVREEDWDKVLEESQDYATEEFANWLVFKQGVLYGSKIGSKVHPVWGSLIGGAVGGILATAGVEQLLDFLIEITFNQEESDNQDNQDNP